MDYCAIFLGNVSSKSLNKLNALDRAIEFEDILVNRRQFDKLNLNMLKNRAKLEEGSDKI